MFFPRKNSFWKRIFSKKVQTRCVFQKKVLKKISKKLLGGTRRVLGSTRGYPGGRYLGVLGGTPGIPGNTWPLGEFLGVLGGTCFSNNFFSKNYENYFFRKLFLSKKLFFQRNNIFKKISLHIFSKKIVLKNYFSEKLLRQFFFQNIFFQANFKKNIVKNQISNKI